MSLNIPDTTSKIDQVINAERVSVLGQIGIRKQVDEQNKIKRIEIALLIVFLLIVFLILVLEYFKIRFQYSDMIKYIDGLIKSGQLQARKIRSGFQIALYYRFPHLPFSPWVNVNTSAAIVFSYYTNALHTSFISSPDNINQLIAKAEEGDSSSGSSDQLSATAIICESWVNNYQRLKDACDQPCAGPNRTNDVTDFMQNAFNNAATGVMVAHPFGGIGALLGGSVGFLYGIGISIWSNSDKKRLCGQSRFSQGVCIKGAGCV